ncbi:hypothetical protein D3C81_592810 [compost metagenome]
MTKGRSSQKLGRFFVLGLSNEKGCAKALLKGIHSGPLASPSPPIVRHLFSAHTLGASSWYVVCTEATYREDSGASYRANPALIASPDKTRVSPLAGRLHTTRKEDHTAARYAPPP